VVVVVVVVVMVVEEIPGALEGECCMASPGSS